MFRSDRSLYSYFYIISICTMQGLEGKRVTQFRNLCMAEKGKQIFNYSDDAAYFHIVRVFLERRVSNMQDPELESRRNESF